MSTADSIVSPSEARLRADLAGEAFRAGVDAGKWRNFELAWPVLNVDIAVGDTEFVRIHLLVDEYPTRPPAGQLWDGRTDAPLTADKWPVGGMAAKVFRTDWSLQNQNAPYLPCDRLGLSTHPEWVSTVPQRSWNTSRTIAFYLDEISGELTDAHLPEDGAA